MTAPCRHLLSLLTLLPDRKQTPRDLKTPFIIHRLFAYLLRIDLLMHLTLSPLDRSLIMIFNPPFRRMSHNRLLPRMETIMGVTQHRNCQVRKLLVSSHKCRRRRLCRVARIRRLSRHKLMMKLRVSSRKVSPRVKSFADSKLCTPALETLSEADSVHGPKTKYYSMSGFLDI